MTEPGFIYKGVAPSAILSDGMITVSLYAVTSMTITATYHLPPIGSTSARAIVGLHDDSISLSGLLVGPERFTQKLLLETLAESSKRGNMVTGALAAAGVPIGGLVLITSMTLRTDMQVQTLTFSASASKRDVIDVSISMLHLPRPSSLSKLLDIANVGVGALGGY